MWLWVGLGLQTHLRYDCQVSICKPVHFVCSAVCYAETGMAAGGLVASIAVRWIAKCAVRTMPVADRLRACQTVEKRHQRPACSVRLPWSFAGLIPWLAAVAARALAAAAEVSDAGASQQGGQKQLAAAAMAVDALAGLCGDGTAAGVQTYASRSEASLSPDSLASERGLTNPLHRCSARADCSMHL